MSLQDKYRSVLDLGQQIGISDGYVEEADGVLKVGGVAKNQYEKDQIWDAIKAVAGENPQDIEADIKVTNTDYYGEYTVASGDTLGKIAKMFLGSPGRYMEVFNLNTDQLTNPDLIKVGQVLKIPNR
jgi:nucleoid-associated protein YgaU